MTKKIFAMFLAVLMVVSLLPTTVFAANDCPAEHTKDNCDCTVIKVVAPTCSDYGYTSYKCDDCGEVFADTFVPATGEHVLVEGKPVAPTCGKEGYEAGQDCELCKKTIVKGEAIAPIFKKGTACKYVDKSSSIDCTTGGTKVEECVNCGHVKTTKVPKAENGKHSWSYDFEDMIIKSEPTATEAGIVIITCQNEACGATKEIEWFPTHNCAETLEAHARVEATCTTNGTIAHYECRVCGKLYDTNGDRLRENETEEYGGIIIEGGHTATITPSCSDKTYTCTVCKAKFVVEGKHVESQNPVGTPVLATCTTKGWATYECTLCHMPVVKETPAKGHVEVTVSVPSTCHTYAYTFTACMRENCHESDIIVNSKDFIDDDNGNLHFDISLDYTLADRLVADDVKYNLSFKYEDEYYYAGAYDVNYLVFGTGNAVAANGFYLETYKDYKDEEVEGAFRLYTKAGDVKTYYFVNNYGYLDSTTSVANDDGKYWSMNEELGVLTYDLMGYYEFFLAASLNDDDQFEVDAYVTEYLPYVSLGYIYLMNLSYPVETTRLVDIEIDYKAKFNKDAHDYAEIEVPATCTKEGSLTKYCKNAACNVMTTEVLPKADHKWNELPETALSLQKVNGAGFAASMSTLVKDNDCDESGWHFEECEYCAEVRRVVDSALGHVWDTQNPLYHTADHEEGGYWYYTCMTNNCDAKKIASAVTAWEGTNKIWDTYTDANRAHEGHLNAENQGRLYVAGSCTTTGMLMYTCSECKKVVYVKQWLNEDADGVTINPWMTGSHVVAPGQIAKDGELEGQYLNQTNYYKPATCETKGYVYSFTCLICGETIGDKAVGYAKELSKTAHNFAPVDEDGDGEVDNMIAANDVLASIINPCPNAKPYKCSECGIYTISLGIDNIGDENLCDGVEYEVYMCSCGEEHIRGLYGDFGHKYDFENPVKTGGTSHLDPIVLTYTCVYCGDTESETLPIEHVNADGDKFTGLCTDEETDRHCVLCCKLSGHFTMGNSHNCVTNKVNNRPAPCACVIKQECEPMEDMSDIMDSSCTMMPYTFFVCKHCKETTVTVQKEAISSEAIELLRGAKATYKYTDAAKADMWEYDEEDEDLIVGFELPYNPVVFSGHKPAKAQENVRYADCVYVPVVYTSYKWVKVSTPVSVDEDGVVEYERLWTLVEYKEEYIGEFKKYEAASFAADGKYEAYCQICDKVVEQILPKTAGLGIEMEAVNANGQAGFGFGSLIEVTVSINALESAIYGFDFVVEDNGMIFVGSKAVNDDFVVTVTKPEEVRHNDKALKVSGFAVNNADGKVQNIEITEKTAVVKLYFRSIVNTGKYSFLSKDAKATAMKDGALKVFQPAENYLKNEITVRGLMDFNGDKNPTSADLYQAMTMITGEHSSGKTYDVAVDLNKDGELTLEDLAIGYDYLVGNYDVEDLLLMGLSEAEAAQLAHLLAKAPEHKCANPACDYASDYEFYICPKCFTFQEEIKA